MRGGESDGDRSRKALRSPVGDASEAKRLKTFASRRMGWGATLAWLVVVAPATAEQVVDFPAEDRWLEAGVEEVYRVGTAVTGEEWEQFGWVKSVAFDGAGNLHIFDQQAQLVYVVGNDGRLIRQLGGPGEGPGEFSTSGAMAVFADGRVVVVDIIRPGYYIFGAGGEFERRVRMANRPAILRISRVVAQPGADAIIGVPTLATAMAVAITTGRTSDEPVRLDTSHAFERTILSGDESQTDTIAEAWLPPIDTKGMDRTDLRRSRNQRDLPEVSAELHWGVLPDGRVAFSDSSTYAVKVASVGPGAVRIMTRPFSPEPVTARVIRAEKDRQLRRLEESTRPGADLQERRREVEELEFHHELSVIWGLGTTWDGRIWVLRRGEESFPDGPIDVLTADGRYLGSYRAGAMKIPDAFGPDGLGAYVERNELGVQTVVVRRVVTDGSD